MIFCIGANHRTASIEERESFFIDSATLRTILPSLQKRFHLSELLVLSTCNRFEIFFVPERDGTHSLALQMWAELQRLAGRTAPTDDTHFLRQKTYFYFGREAVLHAMKVASSLDSLVLGETQITGQFKDAAAEAKDLGTSGARLMRLAQECLALTKKIRSQTDIGKQTVSIAHAAVKLARRIHQDLSEAKFLIVGSGEMARVAAEHASSYAPQKLRIVNRTLANAQAVASRIGQASAHDLIDLTDLMVDTDIVICATSAPDFVVTAQMVQEALKQRKRQRRDPLFLVDIALPRDIDPACSELDDVYVFSIDDLKVVVDEGAAKRKAAASTAFHLIDEQATSFMNWLETHQVSPALQSWHDHVRSTLSREFQKTMAKDLFQALDERQRHHLESMLEAISQRLTSDVAISLKDLSPDQARQFAQSIAHIVQTSKGQKLTQTGEQELSESHRPNISKDHLS